MIRSPLASDFMLSPNVDARLAGASPSILLLHYTGMSSAAEARDWLCNPASKVSCHYIVDEEGRITQMVDEALRAWHAGLSFWGGESDINSFSIGIEIQNPGHMLGYRAFPAVQMKAVAVLSHEIINRYAIVPSRVLAHSDVAPERKIDPGELFDWRWLAGQGIGHWVEPAPLREGPVLKPGDQGTTVAVLQGLLAEYGYKIQQSGEYDHLTHCVVKAFQRHFRPAQCDGLADVSTSATLQKALASLSAS